MPNRLEEELQQVTQMLARLEKAEASKETIECFREARDRLRRELKLIE
jgi:two-component sensor histidine kinase